MREPNLDPPGECRICGEESETGICKSCQRERKEVMAEERADRIRGGEKN